MLLTTRKDKSIYPQKVLSDVYEGRGTALEEGYKSKKMTMQLENFQGKIPYNKNDEGSSVNEFRTIQHEGTKTPKHE